MNNIRSFDLSVLVDMLARHTADYHKMLTEGATEKPDFYRCRLAIKALQSEIESRKKTSRETSLSDPDITLAE
jgi:hypothetical protein